MKAKTETAGKTANPLIYLFKQLWRHSEGNQKNLVRLWFLLGLAGLVHLLVNPFMWSKVFGIVEAEGITEQNFPTILLYLGATVVGGIAFWLLHGPARVMEVDNAFKARLNYRRQMIEGVMMLPMDWHNERHSADTIDKVGNGTDAISSFAESAFEIIYSLIEFVGSLILLIYFFPPSAAIVLVMIMLNVWIAIKFDSVLIGQYKKLNKKENKIAESVQDAIGNITTIIILRVEKLVHRAIMRRAEEPFALNHSTSVLNETKWFLTSVVCKLMVACVLGAYFYSQIGHSKTMIISSVYLLYRYSDNISDLCHKFAGMYGYLVRRRTRLMNAEQVSDDFIDEELTNHVLPNNWKEICVSGLNFTYGNIAQLGSESLGSHLRDISFRVRRGERIAFVGESGSGKTTCMKLMRGLHEPNGLKLSVDGVEVKDGFAGIARAIALIPQSPEIFATTILGNITIGADHDMSTVEKYVSMAGFRDVVAGLPKGYESVINEKGVNLSGGQQQRLALSRGLLACEGKGIILLDEPTSSLDATTERKVYQNMLGGFKDSTIISSCHRLHLLLMFDRIVVFDKGQIVSSGTFQELLATCSVFQNLWSQYSNE